MGNKELVGRYGGKGRNAINRAIRAELAGGGEALDALSLSLAMADRLGWVDDAGQRSAVAVLHDRLADEESEP